MIQPVKVRSSAGYCARVPAQFVGRRMGSLEKLGGEENSRAFDEPQCFEGADVAAEIMNRSLRRYEWRSRKVLWETQ